MERGEARRTRPPTPTAPQNGEVVVDHFERQPLLERTVLFRVRSIFAELMPRVIGHSLRSFGANDVMGKRVNYVIRFVAQPGIVCVCERGRAPKQGSEGAPGAWLEVQPWVPKGLQGVAVADHVLIIAWLHQGRHDVLQVYAGLGSGRLCS